MLRLLVLLQLVLGEELVLTEITQERSFKRVVASLVQSLILGPHEGLTAVKARVRPVASVGTAHVLL